MIRDTLTPRQSEILELIRTCIVEQGCPPTRAEIARRLGFRSANAAEDHLRALERAVSSNWCWARHAASGFDAGLPRWTRRAGVPLLAEQNIEDYCPVVPAVFHPALIPLRAR
jgi:repressor LexA